MAEILLFIKKMVENCRLQLTHAYWHDINHLMERLIEDWCDLEHNIICAALNQ